MSSVTNIGARAFFGVLVVVGGATSAPAMSLCARASAGQIAEGAKLVLRTECRAQEVALPLAVARDAASTNEVVAGNRTLIVGANLSETVGGSVEETTGADRTLTVGGDVDVAIGGELAIETDKSARAIVGEKLTLQADEEIVLAVGASRITIKPSGITLSAPTISIKSSGDLELKGSTISQN